MERLILKYNDAGKALKSFKAILEEHYSLIVRDAAIQRFEYTFEAFWKFLKEYLKEKKGIICQSPKDCFREIFAAGLLTEEETETLLVMTDRRNETVHTYKEEVAQKVYDGLYEYFTLMNITFNKFEKELTSNNNGKINIAS